MNSHARSSKHERDRREVSDAGTTVLVVGGSGGRTSQYRAVVEERGFALRHFESRVPAAARRSVGKVALVVVMVTMVSHALRDHARELAGDAKIVYLKSPSVLPYGLLCKMPRDARAPLVLEREAGYARADANLVSA